MLASIVCRVRLFSPNEIGIFPASRPISTSSHCNWKARTYESKPVPGSLEDTDPLAWAERLFDLHEIRKNYTYAENASPIFMVCRIKPIKGTTFFERAFLERCGIGPKTKQNRWRLIKNTPEKAKELDHIKHLIKIQPITFPDGLPSSDADLINFRLLPNGAFVRRGMSPFRPGKPISFDELTAIEESSNLENNQITVPDTKDNPRYLTRAYLKGWHNQRWQHHQLFSEFFTSKYRYRLNQDGQEYRYSNLWRLDDAMRQSLSQRKHPDGTYRAGNNSRFEADWGTYPWAFY